MGLHVVILAAGQGTRMRSNIPKVLHEIGGRAMLAHVIDVAMTLQPEQIHVVVGHQYEQVQAAFSMHNIHWVIQSERRGTGHALQQAMPAIPMDGDVLVLSADVPLVPSPLLHAMVNRLSRDDRQYAMVLLTATLINPTGLGRLIRNEDGKIKAIVEERDATDLEKSIQEIYTGICCARAVDLARWLPKLSDSNAQGEYYLTDIIALAVAEGKAIDSFLADEPITVQGVNNRAQLAQLERAWQLHCAAQAMEAGVTLADPARFDVRGTLVSASDVFIDINVVLSGHVTLGEGSQIGPNCVLTNVTLGKGCVIKANSVLEDCVIADLCEIGPFARIRPGTRLGAHCKIGNFVEMKNAVFGENSKASHLSYLGDVTVGRDVNIGAGTITCNYDGVNKHQTEIEDGVFIGSDTQLVAPVVIGKHATIGAGSTIRKNAPPNELTLTESKQKTVYGWTRPQKKQKKL